MRARHAGERQAEMSKTWSPGRPAEIGRDSEEMMTTTTRLDTAALSPIGSGESHAGGVRPRRRHRFATTLAVTALVASFAWPLPSARAGAVIFVTTIDREINGDADCSLQEAIYSANRDDNTAPDPINPGSDVTTGCVAGSGHDVIELPPMNVFTYADPIDDADNYMGPTVTPIITSAITIEGRGARLERVAAGRLTRAFAVGYPGFLDLREVHIKGFAIHGGNGNDGGGGGMGAGGAIYVQGGQLLVQWTTFEGNAAEGGDGKFQDQIAGGGGGGLSGDGGAGANGSSDNEGGGGGGGSRGDGSKVIILAPTDYNFGGGGGSEEGCTLTGAVGQGGTFAGDGTESNGDHGAAGGGGAGLGGAVFGYLAEITIINSTFTGNSAIWGLAGGEGANNGRGAGGAIFTVAGDLTVRNSTIAGNEAVTVTNGGGGGIVVYDPEGTDEATLLLQNNIIAGNGAAECYTRNGVDTGGSDGNINTDNPENNLHNPPCPGVIGSDDPGLGALALNTPGRTPTMAIGVTSNAINNAVGTVPLDDQRGIARPQGIKGDVGAYEYEAPAPLPPVTTIALTPATPNGLNGWYKSTVGVSITASDFDSSVAQTRCVLDPATAPTTFADLPDADCALTSVGTDGQHAIYAGSVDVDGNVESTLAMVSFKIDQTPPSLSPTLNVTVVVVGQTGVVASPNASDAMSGLASASCGSIDTSTPGVHSVTCTAADYAGNSASASLAYVVEYRILGFFSPVPGSKWRTGQTVPIKIALGNLAGTRISDAEAATLAAGCRVTFTAMGAQTKSAQCLKYDPVTDQFIYNWKLGKVGTGMATIAVSVSYPGSSIKTVLPELIQITH